MIQMSEIQNQTLRLMALDGARGVIYPDPSPPTSPRVIATIHAVIQDKHESFSIAIKVIRQLSLRGFLWLDPLCERDAILSISFGITDVGRDALTINAAHNEFRSRT